MLSPSDASPSLPKALPLVAKHDALPEPPTSPTNNILLPPPPPPPKIDCSPESLNSTYLKSPDSALRSVPPSPFRDALTIPDMSTPPESPASASTFLNPHSLSAEDRPKKPNPFVDLTETEKSYVDLLSGIIQKVASAWSRSNLPPKELDSMFRSVQAIFKANRYLMGKLKDLGQNPSSPRAIGDLLMKWIDLLDSPYSAYCSQFLTGFDSWEPVQSNSRLPAVLEAFSAANPPPPSGPPIWTLDALFALPRQRIKYYQKLYGRLLKNSGKGKATDKMLESAVERLERLVKIIDERNDLRLPDTRAQRSMDPEPTDEVVIDTRHASQSTQSETPIMGPDLDSRLSGLSVGTSTRASSASSGQRSSRETAPTSDGGSPTTSSTLSVAELQSRLSTERCRDLFTMNAKEVNLAINSSRIPFTREIRLSEDVNIHFTPRSTGELVVHEQGHVFLLTDLFLICEFIRPQERSRLGSSNVDLWLCYPPLAAKHLRVAPAGDDMVEVTILKKEVMLLRTGSVAKRDYILREFQAGISTAASLPPASKQALPPLPNIPRPPSTPASIERQPSTLTADLNTRIPPRSANASPRISSPDSSTAMMNRALSMEGTSSSVASLSRTTSLQASGLPEPPPYQQVANLAHQDNMSPTGFPPGQIFPPRRLDSSRAEGSNITPPIPPGQFIPPPRGQSAMSPPPPGMNGMPPPRSGSMPQQQYMRGPPGPGGPNGQFHPGLQQQPLQQPMPQYGNPHGGPMQMHPQHQPYPSQGAPSHDGNAPTRRPSDGSYHASVQKSPSLRSLGSQPGDYPPMHGPPVPPIPPMNQFNPYDQHQNGQLRPMLSSNGQRQGVVSVAPSFVERDMSPPESPVDDHAPAGPAQSAVTATVKCKVFLKQQHAQWKALGSAKLTLYEQQSRRAKQVVVQADNKEKTMLISTMVLTDGVERVGKTGVAIEISDKGARTGIVYMLQLRNEKAASSLFDMLIAGSDRSGFPH